MAWDVLRLGRSPATEQDTTNSGTPWENHMKKILAALVAFAFVAPAFAAEEKKAEAKKEEKVEKKDEAKKVEKKEEAKK